MIGIVVLSVLLLIWHGKYGQKRINLPFISLLFGGIWAAHIALKYPALGHYDFSFLLISLLSVLFIGSIAFAANIVAFTLYSLPPVAVCLWLNGNEQGLRIVYLLALPMVGIAIQHVIQKRYDNFAQQLMFKLLVFEKQLSDGQDNPLWRTVVMRDGLLVRRTCCQRYRLPDVQQCGDCTLK